MGAEVELVVPARREYVGLVRMLVSALAVARRDIDDEQFDDLKLAVSEAATLAVEAHPSPDRVVVVRCVEEPDALVVDVHDGRDMVPPGADADNGMPDPEELDEDETLPLELIRALIDDVAVIKEGGRDVLRLRITCAAAPAL